MCLGLLYQVVALGESNDVQVESVEGARTRASLLAFQGVALVPGDWVCVHSGYVIDRLDAEEASATVEEIRCAKAALAACEGSPS